MAKRASKKEGSELPGGHTTGDSISAFAADLGKVLGTAKAKAEGWLGQRTQIAQTLESIRDTASTLLSDLGHEAQRIARKGQLAVGRTVTRRGPGRPAGPIGKKRRTMSAKARAAISAAQKARWAKLRAAGKKK